MAADAAVMKAAPVYFASAEVNEGGSLSSYVVHYWKRLFESPKVVSTRQGASLQVLG